MPILKGDHMKIIEGSVTSPIGFEAAGIHAGLKKAKKDMALLVVCIYVFQFKNCVAHSAIPPRYAFFTNSLFLISAGVPLAMRAPSLITEISSA